MTIRCPDVDVRYLDLSVDPETAICVRGDASVIGAQLDRNALPEQGLYAITSTSATYQNAVQAAAAIKHRDPSATTVLGGHHATHEWRTVLQRHQEIDYCCAGEGERTLQDLVRGRAPGEVRGLAYRDTNGTARFTPSPNLTRGELDAFQFETFDFFPVLRNLQDPRLPSRYLDVTLARGCTLGCTFCAFGEDRLRDMSPVAKASLLADTAVSSAYQLAGGLNIHDNDFSQNKRRTHELCDILIGNRIELRWTLQTRAEHLDHRNQDLVERLARAGCTEAYLGVESFDPETACYLKNIPRADRYLRSVDEAVQNLLRHDIDCNINVQLGVPGASPQSQARNLAGLERVADLTRRSSSTARVRVFPQLSVAYPGTLMARTDIRGLGAPLPPQAFELFTRREWEEAQLGASRGLAHSFGHGSGGIPLGLVDADALVSRGEVRISEERFGSVLAELSAVDALLGSTPEVELFDYTPYVHA